MNNYENVSLFGEPIYKNVFELFHFHPFLKTDKETVIFFINGCSGFGSQLTLFAQNGLFVEDYNPNIICLPYFCHNNRSFKYHEEGLYNSFFLYFDYTQIVNMKKKFFVHNTQLSQESFIIYSTPMTLHPINCQYINYIKSRFQLKIGNEVKEWISTIRKPEKRLVGIHIRSIAQKIAHANECGLPQTGIREQIIKLKSKMDKLYGINNYILFIATDVSLYIDLCKEIFGLINYIESIARIACEEDSIPLLGNISGFKLGSDILYDCLALSLCDEIYVSYSNIPFIIDIIKTNNNLVVHEY